MDRENSINYLVKNRVFSMDDVGSPEMEFYIRGMKQAADYRIVDVDRWAHLNTLFGYELDFTDAMEIDNWLWDRDMNDIGEFETLHLTYMDKELLEKAGKALGLELDFSKFRTTDFKVYEYF